VDGDLDSHEIIVVEGVQRMRDGIDVSFDMPRLADERVSQPGITPADGDTPTTLLN
jgi:hypothetical protein